MDNNRWPRVRKEAERQGWEVERTEKGYQLRSPDGATVVTMDAFHASSDPHALDRTVRRMQRQGGFLWPPPTTGGRWT